MRLSDKGIDELAKALASAQGERFSESIAVANLARHLIGHQRNPRNATTIERFFLKVAFGMTECWYWHGATNRLGYGLMNACGESKAHRVSWNLFRGQIPDGMNVLHKCDVRNCVNPDHLFLGTQGDNVRDMFAKGRDNVVRHLGEKNPQAKLTAADVSEMRRIRAETGMPYWQIAERFGVATMTAQRAIVGTSWRSTNENE